jgi:hypothetical protein
MNPEFGIHHAAQSPFGFPLVDDVADQRLAEESDSSPFYHVISAL